MQTPHCFEAAAAAARAEEPVGRVLITRSRASMYLMGEGVLIAQYMLIVASYAAMTASNVVKSRICIIHLTFPVIITQL